MNFSQGFIENTTTLLLTVLFTGILVPFVFSIRDERKLKEQKRFEADIARQTKIIENQVQLLENLASLLWEFQLKAIAVSYYRQFNEEMYYAASQEYLKCAGDIIGKIRSEVSKSLRLVPLETFEELKNLYYNDILDLDRDITMLVNKKSKYDDSWRSFHQRIFNDFANKIDNTINNMAIELGLKGKGTLIQESPVRSTRSKWLAFLRK